MNKMMGFYELRDMQLPSVPWEEYTGIQDFADDKLWTIRTAVLRGEDLNLPRAIGVSGKEAKIKADKLLEEIGNDGIVVFYPYFIADKSGTLNVFKDYIVLEAVKDDLWNLVNLSKKNVTIIINGDETYNGEKNFLSEYEKELILSYVSEIRKLFRDDLTEGRSILLEWSFARNCDKCGNPVGDTYLVFYEVRTV